MNPVWTLRRLSLMSPGEIRWRVRRRAAHRRLERRYQDLAASEKVGQFVRELGFHSPAALSAKFHEHLSTRLWPHDEAEAAKEFGRRFDVKGLVDEAATIVLEGPTVFGHPVRDRNIDWHRDPRTGRRWPRRFCHRIDPNDASVGGIVFTWELNRQLHLYTLAVASLVTGDEKFARVGAEHLASWLDQNPPFVGINWLSPLEMALRAGTWLWFLRLTHQVVPIEPELLARLLYAISLQMNAVAVDRARYSSANNHLLGEAWGLFLVGVCCPLLPGARHWLGLGRDLLAVEAFRQIAPDGVGREQTNRYLAFDFDLLLSAHLLARDNRILIHTGLDRHLEQIADFFRHQMDKNGLLPDIGDNADGRVFGFTDPGDRIYTEVLTSAALLSRRAEFKAGPEPDQKNFWLFGPRAGDELAALPPSLHLARSKLFPDGGYAVLRHHKGDREIVAVVDIGPLGYLSICAHGHADALAVNLSLDGRPMLVDPGTYLYHGGGAWRDYFRSTAAHNTARVDGRDQSVMGGPFLWLRKGQTVLDSFETSAAGDRVQAHHTGLPRGVVHQRTVELDKDRLRLTLTDVFTGRGEHRVELFFHFPPGLRLVAEGSHRFDVQGLPSRAEVDLDPRVEVRTVTGREAPPLGWFSDRFGRKTQTTTLVASVDFVDEASLTTSISRLSSPAAPDNMIRGPRPGDAT
ncbi:MAG: heparinase II/III family protein [Proteobacteria bacterium]|nr:heparinase II/III family protein [Pseudomonadota bacterium]MBU1741481.1 heparinase II/III family protein [Pseudomonadota bacterium]